MRKKILFILTVILSFLPFLVSAEVVEVDNNLNLTGEHNESKIVFGNDVTSTATIDGFAFMYGNNITEKGIVEYGGYFGNQINISGEVKKDLMIGGNLITINKEAIIPRDVFIFGNNVTIKTNIGRNLFASASTINLSGVTVNGDAKLFAETIIFDENTVITGELTYSETSTLKGYIKDNFTNVNILAGSTENKSNKIKDWFVGLITNMICLIVILLLFPKLKEKLSNYKLEGKNIALTSLKGFLTLCAVPIIAIILLLVRFLIPLSLILLVLYFVSFYIGWLSMSYIIGIKIRKYSKQKENMFMESVVGIFLTEVAAIIPYIGGFIGFICFIFGIGIILEQLVSISFVNNK